MSAEEGGRKKRPSATKGSGDETPATAQAPAGGKAPAKADASTKAKAPAKATGSGTAKATKATTKATKATKAATRTATGTARSGGARPRRGAKLDAKALASIRTGLVAEKAELLQRQTELDQESFDGSQSEMTGEVGLGEDYADAGTATFDRERDLSIRNNIQDLMDQIERAIERIDAGTYGVCERCGRPIEAARLKALHHAVLCLDCKRREERAR
ncbi:MAG: TraR/DksA family transcriptional regulator [Actinomycetota bacterium]|nr:TraR/DksA family transcriptional regulator [Actinomycetota bacterium]